MRSDLKNTKPINVMETVAAAPMAESLVWMFHWSGTVAVGVLFTNTSKSMKRKNVELTADLICISYAPSEYNVVSHE